MGYRGRYRKRGKRKRNRKAMVRRSPSMNYQKFRMTALLDVSTAGSAGFNTVEGDVSYLFKSYDLKNIVRKVDASIIASTPLANLQAMEILWDMYRVQYCKLTYRPAIKDGQVITSSGANVNYFGQFPNLLLSYDPDNINVDQQPDQLVQKKGTRSFDPTRSWTFSWKPKRLSSVASNEPGGSAPSITNGGWINLQVPTGGNFPQLGEVSLKSQNPFLDSSGTPADPIKDALIGTILIEYYIEFKSPK